MIVNEAGASVYSDQPPGPRGVSRLRRHAPRGDLDRPAAAGPLERAGQDRRRQHRRGPVPARRQGEAPARVAGRRGRVVRQLRRRGREHGQPGAVAVRVGLEPVDRAAGLRAPLQNGPFRNREQLREVPGFGEATFVQAAGFLKIAGGDNPLDATWIHPESYALAARVLAKLGLRRTTWPTRPRPRTWPSRSPRSTSRRLAEELERRLAARWRTSSPNWPARARSPRGPARRRSSSRACSSWRTSARAWS